MIENPDDYITGMKAVFAKLMEMLDRTDPEAPIADTLQLQFWIDEESARVREVQS